MITTRVVFVVERDMWRVSIFRDNVFVCDAWFHTEWGANTYAAEARLGG